MAPRKGGGGGGMKKLHELAPEVESGHRITDTKKKTFIVGQQFATGGFGRIYTCKEDGKSETLVIKIEPSENGPLFSEVNVFQRILKSPDIEAYKKKKQLKRLGVPWIISCGIFTYKTDKLRFIVIPKYATSLESIREKQDGKFGLKQTMEISLEILKALEYVHEMGYTHADIKAGNILLEKIGNYSTSVLVDFGLARLAVKNEDKPDKKRAHSGTCMFTSIDAHRGCHPSFRGDIEILAYNIIYWLTGTLPWAALEQSPEKTFIEKQKFLSQVEQSVKSVLKGNENSLAIESVLAMFETAKVTNYTSKVNFEKLFKLVSKVVNSAPKEAEKLKNVEKNENATPKRNSRRNVRTETKSEEDEKSFEKEPTIKRKNSPVAAATSKKLKKTTKKVVKSDDEESTDQSELKIPAERELSRSIVKPSVLLAKKIEKKYRRLSKGRGVLQPVLDIVGDEKSTTPPSEVDEKKTPKKVSLRAKSGISSSTKANATKLRQVPGMRNFPKGRRSIIIKETAVRYSKRLEEEAAARPTFSAENDCKEKETNGKL